MLDSCRAMENEGVEITYLPVQKNGIVSLEVQCPSPPPAIAPLLLAVDLLC